MIFVGFQARSALETDGKAWILQLRRVLRAEMGLRKGPTGGFWVELDTAGDSGAGEKPGYVLIDGAGFGTPGPCLQKASKEELELEACRK